LGPVLIIIYLSLCLLTATLGRGRRLGYWGTALTCVIITPFIAFLLLLLFQRRRQQPAALTAPADGDTRVDP
jgi:hypothetical protein